MKVGCGHQRMLGRAQSAMLALSASLSLFAALVHGGVTDLADQPLATTGGQKAKPNLMFILDDSGSMDQQYTPDFVSDMWDGQGNVAQGDLNCFDSAEDTDSNMDMCGVGDPPYMSSDFNQQYYNPDILYTPPPNADGASRTIQNASNTSNWTAVLSDGYNKYNRNWFRDSVTTVNLITGVPDRQWCTSATPTNRATECRRNISCVNNALANFVGSVSGTTLTVTAIASGSITVGQLVGGAGVTDGTIVTAVLTGTGGVGTYSVSRSQTVASMSLWLAPTTASMLGSITETTMTVTSAVSGAFAVGQVVSGLGVTPDTTITAIQSGSGGVGTYTLSKPNATPAGSAFYVANISYCGYAYPEAPDTGTRFQYGGAWNSHNSYPGPQSRLYQYANPYYFRIVPSEYCADSDLKNCTASSTPKVVGATAYNFPAGIRYCKTTSTSRNVDPATQVDFNDCQGQRSTTTRHIYPKFLGTVIPPSGPRAASAMLRVTEPSTSIANSQIGALTVNGVDILNGAVSGQASAANAAAAIATSINTKVAAAGQQEFRACAGNGSTGIGCNQSPYNISLSSASTVASDTVHIFPATASGSTSLLTGATGNALPLPLFPASTARKASGRIAIPVAATAAPVRVTQVTVGSTVLMSTTTPVDTLIADPTQLGLKGATRRNTFLANLRSKISHSSCAVPGTGLSANHCALLPGESVDADTTPPSGATSTTVPDGELWIVDKRFGSVGNQTLTVTKVQSSVAEITIANSGNNQPITISSVAVGGTTITGSAVTASNGTNDAGEADALATALAASINNSSLSVANRYTAEAVGNKVSVFRPIGNATTGTTPTFVQSPLAAAVNGAYAELTISLTTFGSTRVTSLVITSAGGCTSPSGANLLTSATNYHTTDSNLSGYGSNSGIADRGPSTNFSFTNPALNKVRVTNNRGTNYSNSLNGCILSATWNTSSGTSPSLTSTAFTGGAAAVVTIATPITAFAAGTASAINATALAGGQNSTMAVTISGNNGFFDGGTDGNVASRSGVGSFKRVDLVPGIDYPKGKDRLDCTTSAGACTYAEEMTNYANWYAYYRTRMQTMKSAAGRSFLQMNSDYRIGFTTINYATSNTLGTTAQTRFLPIADFSTTQKSNWYTKLYDQTVSGGTPLKGALRSVGNYFADATSGPIDSVYGVCQQNYALLTTDGYANETFSSTFGNFDNVESTTAPKLCTRANGCYDGGGTAAGFSNTLADVAAKFASTDIRTDLADKVPTTLKDNNEAQHMVTYTLGLGVNGLMRYRSDYELATEGDFYKIKIGDMTCTWVSGICNWPALVNNSESAVDDLWHAAVTGRGKYFSARNPNELATSLSSALQAIQVSTGAAAAAATSTPNVTQDDNYIFRSTYRTVKWDGEVFAEKIDVATGEVLTSGNNRLWAATATTDARISTTYDPDNSSSVTAESDNRLIYTFSASATNKLESFTWAKLNGTLGLGAHFSNKCVGTFPTALDQCVSLNTTQKGVANSGAEMVNYLRGHRKNEAAGIYRARDHVLGDVASAAPAYVRKPKFSYIDTGYAQFKIDQNNREGVVYVAANDGMLHAFKADGEPEVRGKELWAYVPRQIVPNLWNLASTNYGTNHKFFVDGTPETGDVVIDGQWKTILVGGLNRGGRGYYALDITDPNDPKGLWEICADSTLCAKVDTDIGYTYGNPIITKLKFASTSSGGEVTVTPKWVVLVTSGYNNVSPGSGGGFLYVLDVATGDVLAKLGTKISTTDSNPATGSNVGTSGTPSGFSRISGWVDKLQQNNLTLRVYGGDLLGNLWRFDLNTPANTVASWKVDRLAQATDTSGNAQSITTKPRLGACDSYRMVAFGTGRMLGGSDISTTQMQSLYGVRDYIKPASGSTPASLDMLGRIRENADIVQQTITVDGSKFKVSRNPVDLSTKKGWFVDLNALSGSGGAERLNIDPELLFGTFLAITNVPDNSSNACSTGGSAYQYDIALCNGQTTGEFTNPGENAKIADNVVVGYNVIRLPDGRVKVIVVESSGGVPKTIGTQTLGSGTSRKTSWRELTPD